jgi:hypothetical protein
VFPAEPSIYLPIVSAPLLRKSFTILGTIFAGISCHNRCEPGGVVNQELTRVAMKSLQTIFIRHDRCANFRA